MNASRTSEHLPVRGEKTPFRWDHRLQRQQYNVGEKHTVILYTYINRHAGTLLINKTVKTRTKHTMSLDYNSICYIGSRIL